MTNVGTANIVDRLRERFDSIAGNSAAIGFLHAQLGDIQTASLAVPSVCLIDGCNADPIGSHVIPKAFLRRMNSDRSWPVTPQILPTGEIRIEKLERGTHPKFRGYCRVHDNEVFGWESSESFAGPTADETQLMRVSDAMWHEYGLRADALESAARLVTPYNPSLAPFLPNLAATTVDQMSELSTSLAASANETRGFASDIDQLRHSLRRSAGLVGDGEPAAVVRRVSLPAACGDAPQLADAAWVPISAESSGLEPKDRVPFAISVLCDVNGTHLVFASTEIGGRIVEKLSSVLNAHPQAAIMFILHWVRHGCFYWFMGDELWNSLGSDEQSTLKEKLKIGPHTKSAIYARAGVERLPIIRVGNGWA